MKQIHIAIMASLMLLGGATCAFAQAEETDNLKRIIQLEQTNPDTIVDGVASAGQTIKVKVGAVVQVEFAQVYNADPMWWFAGIKPGFPGFFLLNDFVGPPLVNGQFQLHVPGKLICRYTAAKAGTYILTFKHGARADNPQDQPLQPHDQKVTITIEVD